MAPSAGDYLCLDYLISSPIASDKESSPLTLLAKTCDNIGKEITTSTTPSKRHNKPEVPKDHVTRCDPKMAAKMPVSGSLRTTSSDRISRKLSTPGVCDTTTETPVAASWVAASDTRRKCEPTSSLGRSMSWSSPRRRSISDDLLELRYQEALIKAMAARRCCGASMVMANCSTTFGATTTEQFLRYPTIPRLERNLEIFPQPTVPATSPEPSSLTLSTVAPVFENSAEFQTIYRPTAVLPEIPVRDMRANLKRTFRSNNEFSKRRIQTAEAYCPGLFKNYPTEMASLFYGNGAFQSTSSGCRDVFCTTCQSQTLPRLESERLQPLRTQLLYTGLHLPSSNSSRVNQQMSPLDDEVLDPTSGDVYTKMAPHPVVPEVTSRYASLIGLSPFELYCRLRGTLLSNQLITSRYRPY